MVLFFARGKVDSDAFINHCYFYYRDIMASSDNILPEKLDIIREDRKKPRFQSDNVFFNLSHKDDIIMLGISHSEIGVDIEHIKDIEYSKIKFIDAENLEDFFYKWTQRESYLKYTGKGLSDLRCVIPSDMHFEHFPVFSDYIACVCTEPQSVYAYEMNIDDIDK